MAVTPVLVCALLVVASVAERTGVNWFSQPLDEITVSEAAGIPRAAVVLKLIRDGADPNARYPVRRGFVGNDSLVTITPLEAAVMRGELSVVQLLDANGARRDAAATAHLIDLAQARGAEDVVEYLHH